METEYDSLSRLISNDREAMQYFNSLPVREQQIILDRGTGCNTLEKLKAFASMAEENLF